MKPPPVLMCLLLALAACAETPAPAAQGPSPTTVMATARATPTAPPGVVASAATPASPAPSPTPPPAAVSVASPSISPSTAPIVTAADPCQNGVVCVLNPAVSQATIQSTICVVGWTATVRPPVSYTSNLKRQQMAALHLPGSAADYEEDHRVPLELGGSPADPYNLTPELRVAAGGRAELKDADENAARAAVCSGSKSLAQAQADFVAKWLVTWPGYRSP